MGGGGPLCGEVGHAYCKSGSLFGELGGATINTMNTCALKHPRHASSAGVVRAHWYTKKPMQQSTMKISDLNSEQVEISVATLFTLLFTLYTLLNIYSSLIFLVALINPTR